MHGFGGSLSLSFSLSLFVLSFFFIYVKCKMVCSWFVLLAVMCSSQGHACKAFSYIVRFLYVLSLFFLNILTIFRHQSEWCLSQTYTVFANFLKFEFEKSNGILHRMFSSFFFLFVCLFCFVLFCCCSAGCVFADSVYIYCVQSLVLALPHNTLYRG